MCLFFTLTLLAAMVFGGFVAPQANPSKSQHKNWQRVRVWYCFVWRFAVVAVAVGFGLCLGYPFATDKKQKWICFRLCFWSVGCFPFPFINLCTSHSIRLRTSLCLIASAFVCSTLATPCFEWFGAIHYYNSALLISIDSIISISLSPALPFCFWFILHILHYNLFALVSLSSLRQFGSPPHKFRMKKIAIPTTTTTKQLQKIMIMCYKIAITSRLIFMR